MAPKMAPKICRSGEWFESAEVTARRVWVGRRVLAHRIRRTWVRMRTMEISPRGRVRVQLSGVEFVRRL